VPRLFDLPLAGLMTDLEVNRVYHVLSAWSIALLGDARQGNPARRR
jgi:hypothetical protein